MRDRAQRMGNLREAFSPLAISWQQQTDKAFSTGISPKGESFPDLALSTLHKRAAKLPGARRRSKKTGQLTRSAARRRADAVQRALLGAVPGSSYFSINTRVFRPLVDNGRARQATHYEPTNTGITLVTVKYLLYHVGGFRKGNRYLPKRNPLVVEYGAASGELVLIPSAAEAFGKAVTAFVETGRAAA